MATGMLAGLKELSHHAIGRAIKRQIVTPRPPGRSGQTLCRNSMDRDAIDGFLGGQLSMRVVIELLAGDDVAIHPNTCEMEHEIAEDLAGRRLVGEKVAIKDNETRHQK